MTIILAPCGYSHMITKMSYPRPEAIMLAPDDVKPYDGKNVVT